jgi:hypothetical protein
MSARRRLSEWIDGYLDRWQDRVAAEAAAPLPPVPALPDYAMDGDE